MPGPSRRLTAATARDMVETACFTPAGTGRVGLELELLLYRVRDRAAPPTPELLAAVERLPLPGGSRVSFEPGGQVELSGPPAPDVGAACIAMADDLAVARDALAGHGAELVGLGIDPVRPPRRVVLGPRYDAMEAFFDADGPDGRVMMCSTASVQVNLDFAADNEARNEADDPAGVDQAWALANALSPVLGAAFANSPVAGRPATRLRSSRLGTWRALDPSRTAPVPLDAGRAGWSQYALDARVMLIRADEQRYVPQVEALTFAGWIEHGHPLGWPDEDDLAYHLTTLFPPVRPRRWLELRVVDALPDPWWRVAAAVATALLHDAAARDEARRATRAMGDVGAPEAEHGLDHPVVADAARRCFAAALEALPRVSADKVTVDAATEFVDRFVARGRCPADDVEGLAWD